MALMDIKIDKVNNNKFLGLLLAVVHHGLANLAERSVPPRTDTVVGTAMDFEDHLNDVPTSEWRRSRSH